VFQPRPRERERERKTESARAPRHRAAAACKTTSVARTQARTTKVADPRRVVARKSETNARRRALVIAPLVKIVGEERPIKETELALGICSLPPPPPPPPPSGGGGLSAIAMANRGTGGLRMTNTSIDARPNRRRPRRRPIASIAWPFSLPVQRFLPSPLPLPSPRPPAALSPSIAAKRVKRAR
jgi:hypothetical protein